MSTSDSTSSTTPKLWVVIPAYNEEEWIEGVLIALSQQSYRDFAIVVVDNNSTDNTTKKVREFADSHTDMSIEVISETQKGTGAASDTGMRHAINAGATWIARTDADCQPHPEWTARIVDTFHSGLKLISGQLLPRKDEGLSFKDRLVIIAVMEFASIFGKIRKGNKDPQYLGPYVMTPGCNMAITAELYEQSGGFPRTKIEDLHEDRALVNAVRKVTADYGARRNVKVYQSQRRIQAWGIKNTLAWYADHRYRPPVVDIR